MTWVPAAGRLQIYFSEFGEKPFYWFWDEKTNTAVFRQIEMYQKYFWNSKIKQEFNMADAVLNSCLIFGVNTATVWKIKIDSNQYIISV